MIKSDEIISGLEECYPLCCEHNKALFEEISHHVLIMQDAADKLGVPLEELMDFFYKGKIKMDLIKEQEEVLTDYEQTDKLL